MSNEIKRVEELTRAVARTRSRLEADLDELNQRGHRLMNAAKRFSRPPTSVVLVGAAGCVATALIVHRVRSRRRRPQLSRQARPGPEKSLLGRGLESAAGALLTLLVQRLGTRGIDSWLTPAPSVGNPGAAATRGIKPHLIVPVIAAK
jgi:hypothetical protein